LQVDNFPYSLILKNSQNVSINELIDINPPYITHMKKSMFFWGEMSFHSFLLFCPKMVEWSSQGFVRDFIIMSWNCNFSCCAMCSTYKAHISLWICCKYSYMVKLDVKYGFAHHTMNQSKFASRSYMHLWNDKCKDIFPLGCCDHNSFPLYFF
jgi:hypothetical protein